MNTYLVWCPDLGEDESEGRAFDADDSEDAAIQWAVWKDEDSGENAIANGGNCRLMVRNLEVRALYAMRTYGEWVPFYYAVDESGE